MTEIANICDVCSEIFAGGDAPKRNMSLEKTDEYNIPIYSNGEVNDGLYGFTNFARVFEPSITISARGTIGYTSIRNPPFVPIVRLITLVPKIEIIDIRYLFYAAQNYKFDGSGTSIPQLTVPALKKYSFPLPTMKEQKRIVVELDKICNLITLRRQQLSKLDEFVKSRFIEMFGIGFEEDTLLNLCNIIDYRGKTPEKVEEGLPFITAKNIRMHSMNMTSQEFISKETYDKVMVRGFPKEGDVVFTTEAPLGNVCRIPHFDSEFYIGQRIVTLQTEKLEPIYLEYALDTNDFAQKLASKASGSTVTGIRVRLLEQLTIPVPPIALQKQFATFVEQVDKSKFEIQKSLEKLETLKKALMQKYFG